MERLQNIFISFLFLTFCFSLLLNAQQLAFPGAEGFGAYTTGGRYGTVYHVINLDDSGPGSLRDAVSQPNRTVVFDVGGIINIGARIVVSSNITIAGQTAPGGGITVYGNGMACNSGNNIVRYIRIRMGKNGDLDKDAVSISSGHNYIFDHVSISWGRDGTLDVNDNGARLIDSLTFQDCIIAQGINLDNHSTGGLMQSGTWSVIRSLYIDNKTRNPKARGRHEFINSVLYNWSTNGYIMGDTEGLSECNLIGNYFIYGPSSGSNTHITGTTPSFHVYTDDNWVDTNKNGVLDGSLLTNYKTATVESLPYTPGVNIRMSAQDALNHVISFVGATHNSYRDAVDSLLISQLTSYGTSGQIINTEDDNGIPDNVGTVPGGTAPTDTDQDGMPDAWEDENDLDRNNHEDRNGDRNDDGFTNLEEYLNSLVPIAHREFPPDSLPLSAPSGLTAVTFSGNQVDLDWTDNANNERGFLIQYSDDDWSSNQEDTTSWANVTSYSVSGLSGSTRYQFRVAAYNNAGNSEYSNIASDSTIADNHFFLHTRVDGQGSIILDPPGGIYAAETEVQVTAIPDLGYVFDSWTGGLSSADNPDTVTVTTTITLTARFTPSNVPMDYDFGPGSLEPGYIQVTTADAAYFAGRGYGFLDTSGLDQQDRGEPDALREDFLFAESPQSFLVDLPNGEYNVTIIAGDNLSDAPNGPMDVFAENEIKVQAMQSAGGEFAEEKFNVVISDDQFNMIIRHSTGSGTWRINALEITPISVAIENTENVPVSEFRLEQNYPNPFNPNTTISYSIPKTSQVTLVVFDMLGREVVKLVDAVKKPGSYTVLFHADDLASGIYFYTLQAGDIILMKKTVLLK